MANIAIILAGGIGTRMGKSEPKQFININDKPIIIHSIEAFENHEDIDEIIVVLNKNFKEQFHTLFGKYNFSKITTITEGGKERSDSSCNALKHIAPNPNTNVLIHDAVRPFVSKNLISKVLSKLQSFKAVNVGVVATDTVLLAGKGNEIKEILPRENIYLAQTPQGFKADIIHKAYSLAAKDIHFKATDDCSVVHHYCKETSIGIVSGEVENIKITYPSDLL